MIIWIILYINIKTSYLELDSLVLLYKKVYLLKIILIGSVDAFDLISGLIGYKKYKISNRIYLYSYYYF